MQEKYKTIIGFVTLVAISVGIGAWSLVPFIWSSAQSSKLPENSTLPFTWGMHGVHLVQAGVIDRQKMGNLYQGEQAEILDQYLEEYRDPVQLTPATAPVLLNLLWAFGLANTNTVLTTGPMMDARYGGAQGFASTGGWTLAQGGVMDHYAHHQLVTLTPEQQAVVERMAQHIFRPCCNNPSHFPDCNHGMAMLGALELMAAQGLSEKEMYQAALALNESWFPSQYEVIKAYLAVRKIPYDPRVVLDKEYSSGSGFQNVQQQMPEQRRNSSSCGV